MHSSALLHALLYGNYSSSPLVSIHSCSHSFDSCSLNTVCAAGPIREEGRHVLGACSPAGGMASHNDSVLAVRVLWNECLGREAGPVWGIGDAFLGRQHLSQYS